MLSEHITDYTVFPHSQQQDYRANIVIQWDYEENSGLSAKWIKMTGRLDLILAQISAGLSFSETLMSNYKYVFP